MKKLEARHCAFVTYFDRPAAEKAMLELQNKTIIRGHRCKLLWGRPQERKPEAELGSGPGPVPQGMLPPQACSLCFYTLIRSQTCPG